MANGWFVWWVLRTLGAESRREINARETERKQAIREICLLGEVAGMAPYYISHGWAYSRVVDSLANCARSRPN